MTHSKSRITIFRERECKLRKRVETAMNMIEVHGSAIGGGGDTFGCGVRKTIEKA
jgi:hypothetical protein